MTVECHCMVGQHCVRLKERHLTTLHTVLPLGTLSYHYHSFSFIIYTELSILCFPNVKITCYIKNGIG